MFDPSGSDLRGSPLYREAESLYEKLLRPGTAQIVDAAELHVSNDGRSAVFSATILDGLEGVRPTRIARIDLPSGSVRVLTLGPGTDRSAKFSPDNRLIAFLSNGGQRGDFQLRLLDTATDAIYLTSRVVGCVESLQWSPDGTRILLGVAAEEADTAGANGSGNSGPSSKLLPSWMPTVKTTDRRLGWRSAWIYELSTNRSWQVSSASCNVWEASWCGDKAIAVVSSPSPDEGLWYSAHLQTIDLHTSESADLYKPKHQIGYPMGSPSGASVAIVEAVCSDRCVVAGELHVVNVQSKLGHVADTQGVDVSSVEWCSDSTLLVAGHRGFETVVGVYDIQTAEFTEQWTSTETTTGGRYATIAALGRRGDCALVGEGFIQPPEIAVIEDRRYRTVKSFVPGPIGNTGIATIQPLVWNAPDGLAIQGWLLSPEGKSPFPLITYIHGGPVWHWRPVWLGRTGVPILMLLRRGYAVLFPNPRGSGGRGQGFASAVIGDMGGADTEDLLSGIDFLVERGTADPQRLGVTGHSYGGFMTAWLIARDARFGAAVTSCPIINYVTEHLISNIPHWVRLFLADPMTAAGGQYFERSPITHAHKVRTPTLNVCGALDRSAPPEEAIQFHNALLENGVKSALVTYPEEGHGIRAFPALIDYAARVVNWFSTHLPPQGVSAPTSEKVECEAQK